MRRLILTQVVLLMLVAGGIASESMGSESKGSGLEI